MTYGEWYDEIGPRLWDEEGESPDRIREADPETGTITQRLLAVELSLAQYWDEDIAEMRGPE